MGNLLYLGRGKGANHHGKYCSEPQAVVWTRIHYRTLHGRGFIRHSVDLFPYTSDTQIVQIVRLSTLVGRSVGEGKLRDSGTRYKEGPLSGHVNKVGFRATFSRPQLEMGLLGGFLFVVGLTQVCGNMDLYLAESEVMKLMGNWQKRIRRELYLIRACGYWFPHSHCRHVRPAILRETRTGE